MRLVLKALCVTLLLSGAVFSQAAQGGTISLDGDWNFLADPQGTLKVTDLSTVAGTRPTRVPSSWQTQFADLRDYAGVAWYWRSIAVQPPEAGQVVLLRFGAVDYLAEVYVNGQKAGSHEGGYLPFEFDVTSLLHAGENQVAVRVVDPGAKPSVVEGIDYAEIPHGKQNWYVQTSGLWQSVALDSRPRLRLGALRVSAPADGNFKMVIPLLDLPPEAELHKPAYLGAEILDPSGKSVWKQSADLVAGQTRYEFSGHLDSPHLWSPADPALYTLHAWVSSGDSHATRFGFRSFEARGGKFYLNGQAFYMRGALDQDFYPDTAYTPPSLDYIKDEMQKAKALGLNLLRCHIKIPDPRYLQAADEAGMLVWYEIPNWDKLTDNSKRRASGTLRGMVERDANHPCIVIVSILNESWGADLKNSADRQWLKQAYQEAKALVPGWLVDDNSPCCDNFHVAGDLADFHNYNSIPDYAGNFDRFVGDFATRPGWLDSPYADAIVKGDEPLVLSEFGNWGLPPVPEEKPWWFSRDFEGRAITKPEGVEKRFADYGYSSLFPDLKAFTDATEQHEFASLKYEIKTLRSHPEIQGYVITEFTDVNWESNGLLDMWRRPKVFTEDLGKLQQDDRVVVRADQRNFQIGEPFEAAVSFSHYQPQLVRGAIVQWQVTGTNLSGTLPLPEVALGSGASVGKITFAAPTVSAPTKEVLRVSLVSGGQTLGEDSLEFFVYPPEKPLLPPPVFFEDPGGRLRRLVNDLHDRNYEAPTGNEAFPILVASQFDDRVKDTLRAGGRVVLIADDKQTLAPGIEILPRSGDYEGNWISNFLWVRKDNAVFKGIGFATLPGFEIQSVVPVAVVKGIPPQNFNDVLAGMFYGWIHSNVGVLVQARCGKGILIICTLSLATSYGSDPYATYLLDSLMNYAISSAKPTFEIPL